ncbi:MAG: FlgD immunoglobulin-like domain containing protein [Candidatus Eisenbacteria bacterium]
MRSMGDLFRRGLGFLCLVLVVSFAARSAGANETSPPVSMMGEGRPLDTVAEIVMPPVDAAALLAEDEERLGDQLDAPNRFAFAHRVDLRPSDEGTWEVLGDGSRLWRLRIRSDGAFSLNVGFTTFRLPEGATFHFFAPDGSTVWGPYTAENAVEGEFWSPILRGDEAVLELFVPANASFEAELFLASVNHDYRGFAKTAAQKLMQGYCNNDVICPVGDPWRDDIRSEGVYTVSGSWYCSGQMLNTAIAENPPPYFLTAYHCGVTTSNDQTVRIYWNFESPTCGQLCCGSLAQNQYGTIFRSRYSTSDFCLLQCSADPPEAFNVYYAGWDATGQSVSSAVGIHHPNCDEKAISFQYDPLTVTSYLSNSVPGNGSHWRVDDWEDGTTEPGSSGSGLWDNRHRLVGQLHGGYASCSSITSDWYGRFSVSWNGGGTMTTRLVDWLDPTSSGVLYIDGRDPGDIDTDVESGRPVNQDRGLLFSINPNPVRGSSHIFFELKKPGRVELEVFNASGRLVSKVPAKTYPAGTTNVTWDGTSPGAGALPDGIYFVRMLVDDQTAGTQKFVMIR